MAKAEYWQKGSAIDYTNATATRIEANEIVPLTTRIGIAGMPIEAGATGHAARRGRVHSAAEIR